MKISYTKAVVLILILLLSMTLIGCAQKNSAYDIDRLSADLKSRNYVFEVTEAEQDFLPTTRKRLQFENAVLDVYLYEKAEDMELDAQRISIDGCSYKTENKGINVSWVSLPHFLKKGTIIVQYIGEDDIIISDLTAILGEEFAGYGKIQALNSENAE